MPFKSKDQWRKCFATHDKKWDCKKWAHETKRPFKSLPTKKANFISSLAIKLAKGKDPFKQLRNKKSDGRPFYLKTLLKENKPITTLEQADRRTQQRLNVFDSMNRSLNSIINKVPDQAGGTSVDHTRFTLNNLPKDVGKLPKNMNVFKPESSR